MSSSPAAAFAAISFSQSTSEPSRSIESNHLPAGGLGIDGITLRPEVEPDERDAETEDRASFDTPRQYLRPPEKNSNGLHITPALSSGISTSVAG
jgi:hypothetical protein